MHIEFGLFVIFFVSEVVVMLFSVRIGNVYSYTTNKTGNQSQYSFFWVNGENYQYDESRPRCAKRKQKTVSDFYGLKTPPAPAVNPDPATQTQPDPGPRYLV